MWHLQSVVVDEYLGKPARFSVVRNRRLDVEDRGNISAIRDGDGDGARDGDGEVRGAMKQTSHVDELTFRGDIPNQITVQILHIFFADLHHSSVQVATRLVYAV